MSTVWHRQAIQGCSVAICGISVGWMVGLSVSPVVQITLNAVLGVLTAAVATVAGIQVSATTENDDVPKPASGLASIRVSITPIALFCFFTALGASCGVFARTNALLGGRAEIFTERWRGTGLSAVQLQQIYLRELYPSSEDSDHNESAAMEKEEKAKWDEGQEKANRDGKNDKKGKAGHTANAQGSGTQARSNVNTAGLFSVSAEDCGQLFLLHGDSLRGRLIALDPDLRTSLAICPGEECGEMAKEMICAKPRSR